MKLDYFICNDLHYSNFSLNEKYLLHYNGFNVTENYGYGVRSIYFNILPENEIIKILKEKIDNKEYYLREFGNDILNLFGHIIIEIDDISEEEMFYLILKYGKEKLQSLGIIQ